MSFECNGAWLRQIVLDTGGRSGSSASRLVDGVG